MILLFVIFLLFYNLYQSSLTIESYRDDLYNLEDEIDNLKDTITDLENNVSDIDNRLIDCEDYIEENN